MTDYVLPTKGKAKDFEQVLDELVHRYEKEGNPVHFTETAIEVHDSTASSILKYLSQLGLLKNTSSGEYVPEQIATEYVRGEAETEDIIPFFEDDEIYSEVSYLTSRGISEKAEIIEKTMHQKSIPEEDKNKLNRAVSVFDQFDVLHPQEGRNTKEDAQKQQDKSKTRKPVTEIDWSEFNPDDFENPATRAKPEKLMKICEVIQTKGGAVSKDTLEKELNEVENFDISTSVLRDTLKYGVQLNFLKEGEDGYAATQDGYSLALADDPESEFREGLKNHKLYTMLIYDIGLENRNQIDKDTLYVLLRTEVGFTDRSEDALGRKITTLLHTIDTAGYGEYYQGRGSHPTRVEVSDRSLFEDVEEALVKQHNILDKEENKDQTTTDKSPNENDVQETKQHSPEEEERATTIPSSEPSNKIVHGDTTHKNAENQRKEHQSVSVEINIELDLSEVSTDDLKEKLMHIDSFLSNEQKHDID